MIPLKHCRIAARPFGCTTYFPDGAETSNWPWYGSEFYRSLASSTGHGDDMMGYCREHDLCHALLAEFMFDAVSPVLRGSATGKLNREAADYEEKLVYYFQLVVHDLTPPPERAWTEWAGAVKVLMESLHD